MADEGKTNTDERADALEGMLRALGETMGKRFDQIDATTTANHALVLDEFANVKSRVNELESWRSRTSSGVKSLARATSEMDLVHEAKIADQIVAVGDLTSKVDGLVTSHATVISETKAQTIILNRLLDVMTKSPVARSVATAVGAAVIGYLAAHGGK